MMTTTIESVVDEIFSLYDKHGTENHIGEKKVSLIEHMRQCALLAKEEGYEEEVILAALFHDIGHLCTVQAHTGEHGKLHHEEIGAEFLRERGFSEKIVRLVRNHVQAKRYLCARKWKYYRALSPASKKTLQYQGGPMSATEAILFEQEPLFSLSLKLRMWDEVAKERNKPLPDIHIYRATTLQHLAEQAK